MSIRSRSTSWRTWGRTHGCTPSLRPSPATVDELRDVLLGARDRGERVKVVGSGHAANDGACTDGVQVSLHRMQETLSVDFRRGAVRVQAGMRLARLNRELARRGLAIASLGDVDRQTVGGALATGTHGTASDRGVLSSQVLAMTLVLADGSLAVCSQHERPDLFLAARNGIGAVGIVVDVTFACVPAFRLHQQMGETTFDDLAKALDEHLAGHAYFDLLYDFRAERVFTRTRDHAGLARPTRSRARVALDDWAVQLAYGAICRLDRNDPARFDRHVARLPPSARSDFVDRSDRVFVIPQLLKLVSSEYAIPRGDVVPALRALGATARSAGVNPGYAVQVRFTAGDDAYLSPAYGRDTAWINAIAISPMPWETYLRLAERTLEPFAARPHWGKWHAFGRDELRARYPRWEEFQRVRRAVDPDGLFANDYLDRVLDPL